MQGLQTQNLAQESLRVNERGCHSNHVLNHPEKNTTAPQPYRSLLAGFFVQLSQELGTTLVGTPQTTVIDNPPSAISEHHAAAIAYCRTCTIQGSVMSELCLGKSGITWNSIQAAFTLYNEFHFG